MAHQATVGARAGHRNGEPPSKTMARNMADLGHDVTQLAELQARLFAADCQDAARHAAIPSAALTLSLLMVLSCVPITLMGIAWLISELAGLPVFAGFLITAAAGVIFSGVLAAVAWYRLRDSLRTFRRSREEFNQNLRWIKMVLRHSGTRGRPQC